MKVTWETRKICGLPGKYLSKFSQHQCNFAHLRSSRKYNLLVDVDVSCTAVRIPTYRAHSEAITIETEKPVDIAAARVALEAAPGVKLLDDTDNQIYPMPLTATGQDDVEVGRLRKSIVFGDYGMDLFVSGDQLLRGAALNAVIVGEVMANNGDLTK